MTTKYFALLTHQGAARLANAAALGNQVQITHMAVGDGGGTLPTPDPAQTTLIGEKRRAPLNALTIDAANSSQIIAEQIIPENEGGFWIREIGLFDADGVMIAVANCAETYKPQLQEGSGRTQTVRMIIIVNSTDAVTLKIDPSVVLATRQYVDDKAIEVKAYADGLLAAHLAAPDPHPQYLKTADVERYLPVGVPQPWPLATPPQGWLKCNGAPFDKAAYPKLAVAYPSGNLPDLRGEFIRGWDDGRGVDGVANRELLSWETGTLVITAVGADALQQAVLEGAVRNHASVSDACMGLGSDPISDKDYGSTLKGFSAVTATNAYSGNGYVTDNPDSDRPFNNRDYYTCTGVRPRNIAYNYIVRAA
ncbi:phage tail protein [Lonsdalea britannica]|uniref:phage tail protein n=1 Tax=Lonsdalea britannica TaxID=1082704 RepID=UPI000A1F4ED9|nr:phage tail protein [Lonsdalea britannica]OSN03070.1 phage tail protein [Lonsdalea britannica]